MMTLQASYKFYMYIVANDDRHPIKVIFFTSYKFYTCTVSSNIIKFYTYNMLNNISRGSYYFSFISFTCALCLIILSHISYNFTVTSFTCTLYLMMTSHAS